MTPSDQLLMARLRALPEPQRAIEWERACAQDPTLRERQPQFLALLDSAAEPDATRSPESMMLAFKSALEPVPAEGPGTRVGAYQLLQKIGEGGFSTVWLAEQLEPIRRKVAVKIIKLGMDTEEVITRFERERQALALMDHPNIARVFDAGATDSGRPFFVMELVRGTAITRYCDENQLPAEARLRLFIAVCQAVEHAHQKGVIHRDLKPSNILVTLYDGVPVPKVIDFGIAKATGVQLTEKTLVTQFHAFLGTPLYTSPEQMEMSGLDVDTRSDIYSLGVLLYELLCGRLPFDADTLMQSGLEAMRRIVREVDPPRPSTRLDTLPQAERSTKAQQRGTDAAKLSLLLRGDLDWIVMRCLEKDRRRRYDNASGLAEDLARHLAHEPVTACPPSRTYRLQKGIRRHRFAFAAAASIVVALVAGAAVSTWQAIRATRAEREQSRLRVVESVLRQRAEAQALALRHRTYASDMTASDMNSVQDALAKDNLRRAVEILNRQRPKPGELDLRAWEWRYLWQLCRSESKSVLNNNHLLARQLAVSADGNWLATVRNEDAAIELWNLNTREHSPIPMPPGERNSVVAFSPTEPLLAIMTATLGETPIARVVLWNLVTRQKARDWPLALERFEGLGEIAFAADGTKLLTGPGRNPTIWSVPDGTPLLKMRNDAQDHMAMTPDFRVAAIAGVNGDDSAVRLLDTATGKELRIIKTKGEYIDALAFSPDGKVLVTSTGSSNTAIDLWNATTGDSLGVLEGHHSPVKKFVFWPDGKTLASGAFDQTIRLWDLTSHRLLRTLRGHQHMLLDLALLPDNKTLVSSAHDGTVRLWDTTTAPAPGAYSRIEAGALRWKFTPDSQSIVTVDFPGNVRRWRGRGFQERDEIFNIGPTAWNWPIFACLATDRPLIAVLKRNDAVQVWNWETKSMEREIPTSTLAEFAVECVGFVDGGRKLLLNWGRQDKSAFGLYEWNLTTGRQTRSWPYSGPIKFPSDQCISMTLVSPDNRQCVVSWNGDPWGDRTERGTVALLNLDSGIERNLPGAVSGWVDSASFSADGRFLAVPWRELTTVWDLQAFKLVKTIEGSHCAAFTPDGRRLAFGDGRIWDTATWDQVLKLEVPSNVVFDAAFSPDGNVFAGHTQYGELHLWRAPSWAEIEAAEKSNPP